ncbi:hypothetical protein [Microbacterium arborescens]|uniref:hypothetical protein n=1 Tax=Microbacterium arborescens TaxID=33883 RepID=UPI0013B3A586|nr:hypothetical protein [Microbacterium arborescens]
MFDIRLRLATDSGGKGRVLPTLEQTWTGVPSGTPRLTFTLSQAVAGRLDAPFLVLVEYSVGGGWVAPRDDLFIAFEDSGDSIDIAGTVSFVAQGYVPWLAAKLLLAWSSSARNGTRHFRQFTAGERGSATPGHVVNAMLAEGKARGWGPPVSWDFTSLKDSTGQDWSLAGSNLWWTPWQLLTPLSKVLDQFAQQGFCEWYTEGAKLRMVRPGTGADLRQSVVFGGPGFTTAPGSSSFADVFTHLTVVPEKARNWLYLDNAGADTRFGRLESSMTQSGVDDHTVAAGLAQPALNEGRALRREQSYDWTPTGDMPVPFRDFNIGDTVTARPRGGGKKPARVVGLVVSKKAGASPTVRVVTGDKLLSRDAKLAKRTGAATSGRIIGGTGQGLPPTATLSPTPSAPAAVRVAGSAGFFSPDGTARSRVTLAWEPVITADDGSGIDVDTYEVWARTPDDVASVFTQTSAPSLIVDGWEPDRLRLVKVRARSVGGVWSGFSEEISVTPAAPSSVVPKPVTGLAIASNTGAFASDGVATATVRVTWAAVTQATDDQPLEVAAYRAELEDGQAWIELAETAAREVTFTAPSGKARRVRVRARTALGVWGDPSAALSVTGATPAQVTTALAAPTLTTGLGLVMISSNGKMSTGAALPSSFQLLYAETAPASTGPWTRVGVPARAAGQVATVRGTVGDTMFARLVWVDTLGRVSTASAVTSLQVGPVRANDIDPSVVESIVSAVKSVVTEYAVSTSETTAPTEGWSPSSPARTPGTFVWSRTVTTTAGGQSTTSAPAPLTGNTGAPGQPGSPGAPGASATSVDVGNDATAIPTNASGATTTSHTLTIPFSGWVGTSRAAATVAVSGLPSGITVATNTAATDTAAGSLVLTVASGSTLGGAGRGEITLTFTCNAQTFTRSFSWAKALAGTAGGAGAAATSVDVGNEATVIVTTAAGATSGASTITIPFTGFVGNARAAATVAVSGLPSGITVSTNTAGTASAAGSLVLAVASGSTLGGAASGTITLTITCNGIVFVRSFSWSKAIAGATGSPGSPGTSGAPGSPGKGVSSVTPYYLLKAAGTAAPAAPTANPPGGSWTLTEPGYQSSTELYRADLVVFTDGSFGWTSVSKVSAYTASTQAITVANLAQASADGKVKASATDPGHDPGRIWLVLNSAGNLIAIKVSNGSAWSSYTMMADQILVPSSIGTISLGDGVITGPKVATGTLSVDKVEPNFGQNLDLTANGAVNIIINTQQDQGAQLAQTRDQVASAAADAASAAAAAADAQAGVDATTADVDAALAAQAATQAQLDQVSTYYRFGADGAIIGRSDSPTQLLLRNTGASIRVNGVDVSTWDEGQLRVPSLVAVKVVLGNHQLEKFGSRTVMRAL